MKIDRRASLRGLNSLGVESTADELVEARTLDDLHEALEFDGPVTILGGGTNVILRSRVEGRVVCPRVRGIGANGSLVRAAAGEIWHDVVDWTLEHGLGGLENLALIPGLVGAAPCQNIGAYGRELAEVVDHVEVIDLAEGRTRQIAAADCDFGYRDSRFKRHPGRFVVTAVVMDLGNVPPAIDYPDVRRELGLGGDLGSTDAGEPASADPRAGTRHSSASLHVDRRAVRDAVIRVRRRKLPDPAEVGNAGSFFENPIVDEVTFANLEERHGFQGFPADGGIKISAARLIDAAGWKGHRDGAVGVWADQPLVLVNYGGASGEEILALAERIAESVRSAFGVVLEREPVVIGRD